tara:strand:+ start:48 stop:452 length:405 start_codon:yes stop_codon:yes gene_type:complete
MATLSSNVVVSGSFTLTDQNGSVVFSFSPNFTSTSHTSGQAITSGQVLVGTSDDTINIALHNKDRVYAFIKNVDTDYAISVKPDGDIIADLKPGEAMFAPVDIDGAGDSSANLDLDAATAAQKAEFLLCDALDA